MIKIFGLGTLVLLESALQTCPNLENFQLARTHGAMRVFGKVNLRAAYRGEVNWETMEVASCFMEPSDDSHVIGVTFDIPEDEWPAMRRREIDYRCREITYENMDGSEEGRALTFFGFRSDHEFLANKSRSDRDILHERRLGYEGDVYRHDVFPADSYLDKCFRAYRSAGEEAYHNFLDHSFLGDRETTLRQYLLEKGEDISF